MIVSDSLYRIVSPGDHISVGMEVSLYSVSDPSRILIIRVTDVSFSIRVQSIPTVYHNHHHRYLFFFLTERTWIPFYSYVQDIQFESCLIFMDTPYSSLTAIHAIDESFCPYGGFLVFEPFLNNLNMPIANSTLSCYEVMLTHLALPNLPVCGYDKLLSFFPFLYVNFHKYHHKMRFVNVYTTFCMNPIDQFLSIIIPIYLTLSIFPFNISELYFSAFLIYQKYIEISGHCGKKISGNSFTPFMYLPKIFNIHAKVEDHDIHHTLNNCNYSKRFTLWDKVFNTYKQIKLD